MIYSLDHSPIGGHFSKNSSDFVVREVPLYEFSGSGEHSVILIQKKDLTTMDALRILSEFSGVKMRDFGYAGLKDRAGMTTQYVSFPAKFEPNFANFSHEKMKILEFHRHNNKLRIGHLKGNNFFIRLKKVNNIDAKKLDFIIKTIDKQGFANYFGYQRFGKFGDNAQEGLEILKGEKKLKNPKIRDFLISAYQSELFNKWLEKRIEISKFASEFSTSEFMRIYNLTKDEAREIQTQEQFYKLLKGEILGHYPFGKFFVCEDLASERERFLRRDITSAGFIAGAKGLRSQWLAGRFEDEIFGQSCEFLNKMNGGRRFAWSYIDNVKFSYDEEMAQYSLSFYLSKGSYATVVLEEILHRDILEDNL